MRGFTLLELLLVMAIMATVTAVIVPNLRTFNSSQKVVDAASQVQADLRQVQNSASSGLKCVNNTATNWYLELFLDSSNFVTGYRTGATCLNGEVYPAVTRLLPAGVRISQIDLDKCAVTNSAEMQLFRIYYGNIYGQVSFGGNVTTCGASPNPKQVILYLKPTASSSIVNKVIVNTGGAIYVQ